MVLQDVDLGAEAADRNQSRVQIVAFRAQLEGVARAIAILAGEQVDVAERLDRGVLADRHAVGGVDEHLGVDAGRAGQAVSMGRRVRAQLRDRARLEIECADRLDLDVLANRRRRLVDVDADVRLHAIAGEEAAGVELHLVVARVIVQRRQQEVARRLEVTRHLHRGAVADDGARAVFDQGNAGAVAVGHHTARSGADVVAVDDVLLRLVERGQLQILRDDVGPGADGRFDRRVHNVLRRRAAAADERRLERVHFAVVLRGVRGGDIQLRHAQRGLRRVAVEIVGDQRARVARAGGVRLRGRARNQTAGARFGHRVAVVRAGRGNRDGRAARSRVGDGLARQHVVA